MIKGIAPGNWRLHVGLLLVWFAASFGVVFFAHDLQQTASGWPIAYWFAAQGSLLVFIAVVLFFAAVENRREPPDASFDASAFRQLTRGYHKRFAIFFAGLAALIVGLVFAERFGLPRVWITVIFLGVTLLVYAGIGVWGRTSEASEY